jgi:RNA polymerase sigma factor (sigma-70 family)
MGGKVITDEEFEDALQNKDNQAIMGSACAPFRRGIDQDELRSIKLMSLWTALRLWKTGGKKFTSFLFLQTRWNCIKCVDDQKRNKMLNVEIDRGSKQHNYFGELIEELPEDLRGIFIHRFSFGMTLRELSKIYGCCPESARRRLLKGLAILRENH